jgi:hypothetical protein
MKLSLILTLYLLCCLSLFSCAKTDEQATLSAIREARYFLTSLDCQKAKDVLDKVGPVNDNPDFVSVYASSLACQAGYTDLGMALDNLADIDTSGGSMLGSFAAFESSNETTVDATTYSKIVEAINYIIQANGGVQPSTTARLAEYGTSDGNDLSMQALLMITVAMGKYFAFYGNTDASGVKGAGSVTGGDKCIGFYPFDAQVNTTLVGNPLNGCNEANAGHAALDFGTVTEAIVHRRMCEGIILFNNLFEILSNIDLSSNDSLGNISDVSSTISDLFTLAETAEDALPWGGTSVATMKSMTSQSLCEAQTTDDIQRYFVLIFETNL